MGYHWSSWVTTQVFGTQFQHHFGESSPYLNLLQGEVSDIFQHFLYPRMLGCDLVKWLRLNRNDWQTHR